MSGLHNPRKNENSRKAQFKVGRGGKKTKKIPVGMSEAIGKLHSVQKKGRFQIKMLTR